MALRLLHLHTETNPNLNMISLKSVIRFAKLLGQMKVNTEEFDGYLSQVYYVDGQINLLPYIWRI